MSNMIAKKDITRNLSIIDKRFLNAKNSRREQLYSKLAILELCGWIEESMDDIIRSYACRHLIIQKNKDFVNGFVIQKTHSFDYKSNFRRMLIQILGIVQLEKFEQILDPHKFTKMEAALDTLKICRDTEAHTYTKGGTTKKLNAPSATIGQFQEVYEGLKDIEKKLRTLRI
jgi:hypothetical protein